MTRFARAKGSKASNERKEEEATPWHIMKQQFMDLHNTNTFQNNDNSVSELKNLLQRGNTSGKEIWSDFGDINGNKVKNISEKSIKGKQKKYDVKLKEDNKCIKIDDSQEDLTNAGFKIQTNKSRPKSSKTRNCKVGLPVSANDLKEMGPTGNSSKTSFKNKSLKGFVELKEYHNIGKEEISSETAFRPIKKLKLKSEKNQKTNQIEPDAVPMTLSVENVKSIYKKKNIKTSKVKENSNSKDILDDVNKATGSQKKRCSTVSSTQNKDLNSKKPTLKKGKNKKNVKLNKPENCLVAGKVSQNEDLNEAGNVCDYEDQTTLSTSKESVGKHTTVNSTQPENRRFNPTSYNNWKTYNNLHTIIANGREIKVINFEGFLIKQDDAIELKRLRKKLRAQNVTKDKINAILKLERRKAEKSLTREKKSVCFHCRKFGHNFTDCPDIKDSDLSKSGMCFKCGSMEHSHYDCKVLQSQNFRYAVCFVCKEQGHIARQCKVNPHGQYPKGGSCHLCGEITHLRKDCPKVENDKPSNVLTVEKLSHNLIEDINTADETLPKSVKKRKTKHVTF